MKPGQLFLYYMKEGHILAILVFKKSDQSAGRTGHFVCAGFPCFNCLFAQLMIHFYFL